MSKPDNVILTNYRQNKNTNLPYIDSLRGIAILLVILVHTTIRIRGLSTTLDSIGRYGQMGVQLFFIASAFTLCLSLNHTIYSKNWLASFYLKRFFRIAPLYYLAIAVYFAYNYASNRGLFSWTPFFTNYRDYSIKNMLANVFFVHGFYQPANNTIVPGGWSIGTEIAFYAVFPLLFILVQSLFTLFSRWRLLLLPCYIVLVLLMAVLVKEAGLLMNMRPANDSFLYYNLLNQLPVFITGLFLYFAIKVYTPSFPAFLLAGLFVLFTWFSYSYSQTFRNMTLAPLLACLSFVVLFLLFRQVPVLNHRLLRRIGTLSFSMYVFHFLCIDLMVSWLSANVLKGQYTCVLWIVSYIAVVAMSAIIGTFTELYIEERGIAFGRKLIKQYFGKA
jgi:peptidoglycan/LPS O-acetylase OafA/YrhL